MQAVLSELDRAMVMTIHAFCTTLLRERALEAGLDPAFTVVNQAEASLLHDQVWQTWLTQELQPGSDQRKPYTPGVSGRSLSPPSQSAVRFSGRTARLPGLAARGSQCRYPGILCRGPAKVTARLTALQDCCHDTNRPGIRADHDSDRQHSQRPPIRTMQRSWEHFLLHRLTVQTRKGRRTNWQPTAALDEVRTLLAQFKALHLKTRAVWLHNLTVGLAGWLGGYLRSLSGQETAPGQPRFSGPAGADARRAQAEA